MEEIHIILSAAHLISAPNKREYSISVKIICMVMNAVLSDVSSNQSGPYPFANPTCLEHIRQTELLQV